VGRVEIRPRRNEHPKHRDEVYHEIFIDGIPVEMGEGTAELTEVDCKIHGKQKGIYGYNQGGHDGVDICIQCCKEITAYLFKQELIQAAQSPGFKDISDQVYGG
jgi:hypothetical protein